MEANQIRLLGIALMLGSCLLFSTAGIFTKGVAASAWEVIFWRGFSGAILTSALIVARGRVRVEFLHMGRKGLLVAVIGAIGTAAFISAFKLTGVANVALIYATTPLFAALLGWVTIKEAPGVAMMIGAALGVVGICVILSGSLGQVNLRGDMLALVMSVSLAVLFVMYRAWPHVPSAGPMAVLSLLLLPVAAYMANPLQTPLIEVVILAAFGLVFALASVMMLEAAKRLPSGQAGLLSTAETPFAIALAWMILGEWPVLATLIGGTLVMSGVIIGGLSDRR